MDCGGCRPSAGPVPATSSEGLRARERDEESAPALEVRTQRVREVEAEDTEPRRPRQGDPEPDTGVGAQIREPEGSADRPRISAVDERGRADLEQVQELSRDPDPI